MFQFTKEQHQALEALKASPRFKHVGATRPRGNDPGRRAYVICEMIDNLTKVPFAKAEAPTEEGALVAAINEARAAERPATPGQILAERNRLKDELELKDKELAELKSALAKPIPNSKKKSSRATDTAPAESE